MRLCYFVLAFSTFACRTTSEPAKESQLESTRAVFQFDTDYNCDGTTADVYLKQDGSVKIHLPFDTRSIEGQIVNGKCKVPTAKDEGGYAAYCGTKDVYAGLKKNGATWTADVFDFDRSFQGEHDANASEKNIKCKKVKVEK